MRRVETLLRAALGMVEETKHDGAPREDEEEWPKREDTREFQAAIQPVSHAEETSPKEASPVLSVAGGPEDDDSPTGTELFLGLACGP